MAKAYPKEFRADVVARDASGIRAQVSAVPRAIRFGSMWETVGYVEGVATRRAWQRSGIGATVMKALHEEMDSRWPYGVLSTGKARTFYARLGWLPWVGPSYVVLADAEVRTPEEDDGLMVRMRAGTPCIDLANSIACEDRAGDAW